jgi:hypothetical protein
MIRKVVRGAGLRLMALADAWDRLLWCEGSVGRLQRDVAHLQDELRALREHRAAEPPPPHYDTEGADSAR